MARNKGMILALTTCQLLGHEARRQATLAKLTKREVLFIYGPTLTDNNNDVLVKACCNVAGQEVGLSRETVSLVIANYVLVV